MAPAALWSQTVSFAGAQTTFASGLWAPQGIALDGAGNLFVAERGNNRIVKIPAGGGAPIVVVSGLSNPSDVAVDGAGNVYFPEVSNNRVLKFPAGGGDLITVANALNTPVAVALDTTGNLFIAEYGSGSVLKVPAGGGSPTPVVTGLRNPTDVAVDGAGNLFIADPYANRVVKFPAGGGDLIEVGGGLYQPFGLTVDGAGNVFISGSQYVWKVSPDGGQTSVGSGLWNPIGLAVDGAGNVFIGGNSQVLEVSKSGNGGTVNVCPAGQGSPAPCSQTLTLIYNVTASGTLGTAPTVVTQGAPNLDFTLAGGSSCAGDVTAGASCTVNVTFAPLAPGLRMGAVELADASGNLLATTPVYGKGQGPAVAFNPGFQTIVGSGLSPFGVAVDAAGNVFVAEFGNHRAMKVSPGGVQTNVGIGLSGPNDVAVDGMGNVYIADVGLNRVVKLPAGGGAQTSVGNGFNQPYSVSVDGAGNVFIADYNNNRVVKVPADGGAQTDVAVGSALNLPTSVKVDGAGNVFIADSQNSRVLKVPAGGGAATTVGTGLGFPAGLAVDGAGNVFIADYSFNTVVQVSPGGAQTTVASGLGAPGGLAVDGSGNVFIADYFTGVVEVQRSQPPALSFGAALVGGTSSDSPQSITVQNIGNAPLSLSGLVVDANFTQVAGSGAPVDCTSSSSLAPGDTCNLSVSFTPTVTGPVTGTATLTDNSFNGNSVTQAISLSGGVQKTQTITFDVFPDQVIGTQSSLSASASSGLPVSFASLTTAVCTVSGTSATFVTKGVCTIQASQSGNVTFLAAAPVSRSFSVIGQPQTITFNPLGSQVVGGSHILVASASSGLPVSFASLTTSVCTVSGTTATFLAVGTCTIRASQHGNATYAAATPVSRHPAVTDFSLTVTPSSKTILLGQTAVYTATLQPINGFSRTVTLSCTGSSTCSLSPASVTLPGSSSSTISVAPLKRGTFILTIGARAGGDVHAATVILKVQ